MPKIKTNRGAAKRFKKTGTGKFLYSKANGNHILTKKNRKRKRSLRAGGTINKSDQKSLQRMLPTL